MKKLLVIISIFLSLASPGQTFRINPQSSPNWIEDFKGIVKARRGMAVGNFADTGSANVIGLNYIDGIIIKVGAKAYLRDTTTTHWIDLTSSGGLGGSGTLTNFSSGGLSPIFTTSVSNATSTPSLSFTLSNASAYTLFGRGSGSGTPSYLSSIDSNWVTGLHTEAYYNTKYNKRLLFDLPVYLKPGSGSAPDTATSNFASSADDGFLSAVDFAKFQQDSSKFEISGSGIRTKGDKKVGIGVAASSTYWLDVNGKSRFWGDLDVNGITVGRGTSSSTDNTVLGYEALLNNTSNHQVAIGYQAMKASTGGYENVAIGYLAGTILGSAVENVLVGPYAMYNTSGAASRNVAIGKTSLRLVTGNDNVAVGRHSGLNLTSGSNNIAIGSGADLLIATADNQINIGGALWARNKNFTIGTSGQAVDSANKLTVYGTVKITDTLKTPNIGYKGLDSANFKLKVVDASGNEFKTDWPTFGTGGGSMVYPGAGIPLSTGSAWGTSITDNSTNWNTAYTDRLKWDGGATGLNASTGRTSLGLGAFATRNLNDNTEVTGFWNFRYPEVGIGTVGHTGSFYAGGLATDQSYDLPNASGTLALTSDITTSLLGYLQASNNLSDVSSASTARTNLGLAIGTNVQAYDADLTTYAGITPSSNVQSLLGAANYAAMRSQLNLTVGTDVQAYDADLTTYAGITPSANVQTLLGAANYGAFKSSLSLNNVENTALSTWTGSTNITQLGTITVGTIGAGAVIGGATMTLGSDGNYDVYYRGSDGVLKRLAAGTNNYVLTTHGTSSAPTWEAQTGGSGVSDGDKGDITVTSSGASWSIDAGVVSLSKMANITNNRILGNVSGSSAAPAELTAANVKTMLSLDNVDNTSDATKNSATATLTNKRITLRTGTTTSSATPTINTDNVDFYSITALAANITSFTTNLSGTPNLGDRLWISITDNGTPRTIAWGASFSGSLLPSTTVASTNLNVLLFWNGTTWYCMYAQ